MNSFHEAMPGRAHWVCTHPRSNSLNRRLLRAGSAALKRYDVTVSDLYADGFQPALGERDLVSFAADQGSTSELTGKLCRSTGGRAQQCWTLNGDVKRQEDSSGGAPADTADDD